jgi:hypothetical protein
MRAGPPELLQPLLAQNLLRQRKEHLILLGEVFAGGSNELGDERGDVTRRTGHLGEELAYLLVLHVHHRQRARLASEMRLQGREEEFILDVGMLLKNYGQENHHGLALLGGSLLTLGLLQPIWLAQENLVLNTQAFRELHDIS